MKDKASEIQGEKEEEEKLKVNRQEILNLAWLASLGILGLQVSGITILFAYPRFKEGEFGGEFPINFSEVPNKFGGPVNIFKGKFWIVYTQNGIMALYKVCPHLGCLYGWNDQENKFICPCHGSQFKYNGDYILGPSPRSLDYFAIQFIDNETGEVLAETPEEGGPVLIPENPNLILRVDTSNRFEGERHA